MALDSDSSILGNELYTNANAPKQTEKMINRETYMGTTNIERNNGEVAVAEAETEAAATNSVKPNSSNNCSKDPTEEQKENIRRGEHLPSGLRRHSI